MRSAARGRLNLDADQDSLWAVGYQLLQPDFGPGESPLWRHVPRRFRVLGRRND